MSEVPPVGTGGGTDIALVTLPLDRDRPRHVCSGIVSPRRLSVMLLLMHENRTFSPFSSSLF
jgi:hypothetical protein